MWKKLGAFVTDTDKRNDQNNGKYEDPYKVIKITKNDRYGAVKKR